jgi:hypothetical protein
MDRSDKFVTMGFPPEPTQEQLDRWATEEAHEQVLYEQVKQAIRTLGKLIVHNEETTGRQERHLALIHESLWQTKYMVASRLDIDLEYEDEDPQCGRCGKPETYEIGDIRINIYHDEKEGWDISAVLCPDCFAELETRGDTDNLYFIDPPEHSSVEREGIVSNPVVEVNQSGDFHRHKDTWARADEFKPEEGWEKTLHLYGSMDRAREVHEDREFVHVNKDELRQLCEDEGFTLIWYMADGEFGPIFEVQSVEYILDRMQ